MKKIIYVLMMVLFLVSISGCEKKSKLEESTAEVEITCEEALSLVHQKYGLVQVETGYEYQWELEEISEVEGVEYFNFCMTCNVEEVDESDVIIDTYSEYIINVLVSVDDGEILEARENTNTHKWEIEY